MVQKNSMTTFYPYWRNFIGCQSLSVFNKRLLLYVLNSSLIKIFLIICLNFLLLIHQTEIFDQWLSTTIAKAVEEKKTTGNFLLVISLPTIGTLYDNQIFQSLEKNLKSFLFQKAFPYLSCWWFNFFHLESKSMTSRPYF